MEIPTIKLATDGETKKKWRVMLHLFAKEYKLHMRNI